MKAQEYLLKHSLEFLAFLKTRVPVYHLSNIFFRDVHYAVIDFLGAQGMKIKHNPAEPLARVVIGQLEKEKVLVKLDHQTWMVHHPEYRTPVRKTAAAAPAPAKPAASAPPVQGATATAARPAGASTAANTTVGAPPAP